MQTFPEVFYFTYVGKIIGNLDSFGFGKKGKILGIAIRRKATGYFEMFKTKALGRLLI